MKKKILLFLFITIISIFSIDTSYAKENDKYDGEYTIEYLLKNYNVVTLGTREHISHSYMEEVDDTKGSVTNVFDIGGPVLIRGNFTNSIRENNTAIKYACTYRPKLFEEVLGIENCQDGWGYYTIDFAQRTNGIPSYIKGKLGELVTAGSIESMEYDAEHSTTYYKEYKHIGKSDIYVGSSNTVKEKDGLYVVNGTKNGYPTYISDDYLDFDLLYAKIINEQKNIPTGNTEIKEISPIDDSIFETQWPSTTYIQFNGIYIDEPGYYTFDGIEKYRNFEIRNYNPNEIYVITITDEYIYTLPSLAIKQDKVYGPNSVSNRAVYYQKKGNDLTNSSSSGGDSTGNVIFNFPNAKYIHIEADFGNQFGSSYYVTHFIAPKADIDLGETAFSGTMIANSITSPKNKHTAIQFFPYKLDAKIADESDITCVDEEQEITYKDTYDNKYAIDELLKNYSVVALGQNNYSNNAFLKDKTENKGTVSIFHIAGQFLINGDLGVEDITYPKQYKITNYNEREKDGMRLDFKSSDYSLSSYIKGNLMTNATDSNFAELCYKYYRCWIVPKNYTNLLVGRNNTIDWEGYVLGGHRPPMFRDYSIPVNYYVPHAIRNNPGGNLSTPRQILLDDNFIDFSVLKSSIETQQSKIEKGTKLTKSNDGFIHVKTGGNYTIENVNDISKIVFDNFEDNENKLTIITIEDKGNINFPVVVSDSTRNAGLVITNDWFGKTTATYDEEDIQDEIYYGNVVWNIPNATYIKLADDAPFFGHVIAPNADLETPELHFAGTMIVNSLYTEGYSEAHFYPLTVGSVGTGIEKKVVSLGKCTLNISGQKTWDDKDNNDGKRPESITVNLFADGEKVESKVVTEKDNWKYTFKNLKKYKDDIEIVYTVTESAVENYITDIDGYDITNHYTPEKTSLTVNKVWKDSNDADKIRPESVEVEVYANDKLIETIELTAKDKWVYILNDLDMYENGEEIKYTIKEKSVKGYTSEIKGNQKDGYTITNTHKVEVKENPTTGDSISKYTGITLLSFILLALLIIICVRRKKEA